MSDERKPKPGRFRRRERVTLKFDTRPLLLPGEEEAPDAHENASDAAPDATPEGEDAWERQRPVGRRSTPPMPLSDLPPGPDEGGVLDLVDKRSRPSTPTIDLADEMLDRYALGDYTAALVIGELILGRVPDHESAARIAKSCRERLGQLYLSRLGAVTRVPHVAVEAGEVRWLGLDHRAAFLLSRIDGTQTIAEVLDVGGMTRVEALKTLVELLDMGAIGFED